MKNVNLELQIKAWGPNKWVAAIKSKKGYSGGDGDQLFFESCKCVHIQKG